MKETKPQVSTSKREIFKGKSGRRSGMDWIACLYLEKAEEEPYSHGTFSIYSDVIRLCPQA